MAESKANRRGVRVFRNPVLDWASRAHPAFPAVFWVPCSIAAIVWGAKQGVGAVSAALMIVCGFLAWTFFEYVLHRWIFHFVPSNATLRRQYYLVHQIHHEHQEWDRLVAPPGLSLTLGLFFGTLFYFTMGPVYMWPFFGGFMWGYLAYDYVHFYTHFGRPKHRVTKNLRRRHLMHHHAFPNKWYGVSSPFWDYVFRTNVKNGDRPPRKAQIDWNPPIIEDF